MCDDRLQYGLSCVMRMTQTCSLPAAAGTMHYKHGTWTVVGDFPFHMWCRLLDNTECSV